MLLTHLLSSLNVPAFRKIYQGILRQRDIPNLYHGTTHSRRDPGLHCGTILSLFFNSTFDK